ncbi:MAG: DNA primase [Candidatus Lightella neohaematopini]|nr:DNA primase [Candidatus Lightella neohaematopini]
MNKYIPNFFINELLSQVNIIDVIGTRINLKKKGKNFFSLCPFHIENNPSFLVNEEKQFYFCFGCNARGNVINFLMNYDKLDFISSIEELSNLFNLKIPYENYNENKSSGIEKRIKLYKIINKINSYYHKIVRDKISKDAINFLKSRGLNNYVISYFEIGFSPFNWYEIDKYFNFNAEDRSILIKLGILNIDKYGQLYNKFYNRIIFPIKNINGQVIAFGGRIINNNTNPKYINSNDNIIFHKKDNIYGLYEAKKSIYKLNKLIIVEGFIDVITLRQFNIENVVSILGTSISSNQIKMLYNHTNHIIYCYDGDRVGYCAMWKSLKLSLPYLTNNRQISFIFLPKGTDPDTLIRKIGTNKFKLLIKQAYSLLEVLFRVLSFKFNLNNINSRIKLIYSALLLINKIPGEVIRVSLIYELGKKIGIMDYNYLKKLLFNYKKYKDSNLLKVNVIKYNYINILISLLIQKPRLSILVKNLDELSNTNSSDITLFIMLVNTCNAKSNLSTNQLLEYYRHSDIFEKLEKLAVWNHMIKYNLIEDTFIEMLDKLHYSIVEQKYNNLINRDRLNKLNYKERLELWSLNLKLAQHK